MDELLARIGDGIISQCGLVGVLGWSVAVYLGWQNQRLASRCERDRQFALADARERTKAFVDLSETLQFIKGVLAARR